MDQDWSNILYEFNMNYSIDDLREAYRKVQKDKRNQVSVEDLRELGYTEEQIANRVV